MTTGHAAAQWVESTSWELQAPCCRPPAALAALAPKPQLLLVTCKTAPGERSRSYLKWGGSVSLAGHLALILQHREITGFHGPCSQVMFTGQSTKHS